MDSVDPGPGVATRRLSSPHGGTLIDLAVAPPEAEQLRLRQLLTRAEPIPESFSSPSVLRQLRRTRPPRSRQGFTVFFTGLSGAGKSTIANILRVRLLADVGRPVTLLDGDLVRQH